MSLLILLNRKFFLSLLLLYIFSLSGCGLPTYPFLYAPEVVETRTDPGAGFYDLVFKNAYENNTSIFSGYELYYKIYDPLDTDSASKYISDRSAISALSSSADKTTLVTYGFSRLYASNSYNSTFTHDETYPVFSIDSSLLEEEFSIRILFQQDLTETFYASPWNTDSVTFSETPYFYRWVYNSSTNTSIRKYFNSTDFDIYDADLPDTVDIDSYNLSQNYGDYYLYISFYIMSYGREVDDIATSVYSTPEYLGTLKFDSELTK